MVTLFDIADSLLDSASEEYREENLNNVGHYASTVFNVGLSEEHRELLVKQCRLWIAEGVGTHDWYEMLEDRLDIEVG